MSTIARPSSQLLLPGESREEFDHFFASFVSHYEPKGELQRELVAEIASSRWRLRRCAELEARLLTHEIRRLQNEPENPLDDDTALAVAFSNLTAKSGPLAQLHRQEARLRRNCEKAAKELKELRELQADADLQNEPESHDGNGAVTQRATRYKVDGREPRDTSSFPGISGNRGRHADSGSADCTDEIPGRMHDSALRAVLTRASA